MDEAEYGDELRQRAARAQRLAGLHHELAGRLTALDDHGIDTAALRALTRHVAGGLEQIGILNAATALAHDAMMAAGGPDNSRAYVEYEATVRRHRALWPSITMNPEPH